MRITLYSTCRSMFKKNIIPVRHRRGIGTTNPLSLERFVTDDMRDAYKENGKCPVDAIKLVRLPSNMLQLMVTPAGTSDQVLTEQTYRNIDDFNTDFYSDYLVLPSENDNGVLLKDVCSNITQVVYSDSTLSSESSSLDIITDEQLIDIAADAGVSDYNPDQMNEELLKVNELLNKLTEVRDEQTIDRRSIEVLKVDLYRKRETIKKLLETVQKLQGRNSALEEQLRITETLLKDCNANLNKAFLSEKSKYDSVTSNYTFQGDDLDIPSYTNRFKRVRDGVDYLDPTKTYIHQTVLPWNA